MPGLTALAILLLLATSCSTAPSFRSAAPAWSDGLSIATVASIEAPAIGWTSEAQLLAAWADGEQVFIRLVHPDHSLSEPITVADGRSPWDVKLIAGSDGEWHLFWRDFDAYEMPHLFGAHLDVTGQLLRGPLTISPEGVSRYVAVAGDGGTAMLLWMDMAARPTLYGRMVDAQGRPSAEPPVIVTHNAEYPALTRTAEGTWLTGWLAWPDSSNADSSSRTIVIAASQAFLPWQSFTPHPVGTLVFPDFTTYAETFALGLDQETGYALIGLREAVTQSGSTRIFPFDLESFQSYPPIASLSFPADPPNQPYTGATGFNTGSAFVIPSNTGGATTLASRPTPAPGQHNLLPVAFDADGRLVVGYLASGALVAYQPVVQAADPLGGLTLWLDRERHLTLGWANAPGQGEALAPLVVSSTRLP